MLYIKRLHHEKGLLNKGSKIEPTTFTLHMIVLSFDNLPERQLDRNSEILNTYINQPGL